MCCEIPAASLLHARSSCLLPAALRCTHLVAPPPTGGGLCAVNEKRVVS